MRANEALGPLRAFQIGRTGRVILEKPLEVPERFREGQVFPLQNIGKRRHDLELHNRRAKCPTTAETLARVAVCVNRIGMIEIYRRFPDKAAAIAHLEKVRWPDGPHCPQCGADTVARKAEAGQRDRLQCWSCERSFSATVGTIFHNSHIDLQRWFLLIALMLPFSIALQRTGGVDGVVVGKAGENQRCRTVQVAHRMLRPTGGDGGSRRSAATQPARRPRRRGRSQSCRRRGWHPRRWRTRCAGCR